MRALQGKWYYQSFVALPADVDRTKSPPEVKRPPMIAATWTPQTAMELATDATGVVTGTAKLGPFEVKITGAVTSAIGQIPGGVELTVTVEKLSATYKLRGFFLANSDHVVGTVVAISNDLGYQPDGASGPFALFPVRS